LSMDAVFFLCLIIPVIIYFISFSFFREVKRKRDNANNANPSVQSSLRYPFKCPYCHSGDGDLTAGTYCCHECQRTIVFHKTPTEEEAEIIKKEEEDINKIYEPSFNLDGIRQMVYHAYINKPKYSFIAFKDSYAELVIASEENKTIAHYPSLETKAGIQALTHQCLIYVKEKMPLGTDKVFNEGHGFFSDD